MNNLVFESKYGFPIQDMPGTATVRVSEDTHRTLWEIRRITGMPMTKIIDQIVQYGVENAVFVDPNSTIDAEENDAMRRLSDLTDALERAVNRLQDSRSRKNYRYDRRRAR